MPDDESITRWIADLKQGDEQAVANIWGHFYARLLRLARRRLNGNANSVADEEDVVAKAIASFIHRAQDGQFPLLANRNDLWRLLGKITVRKALNQQRDQKRLKRGAGHQLDAHEAALMQIEALDPAPENVAMASETFERLLALLDDDLRQIAIGRLEGYTLVEIAARIGRSVPTVERRLRLIRDKWSQANLP